MILKIEILNIFGSNYLYVKFKNIVKEEITLMAEKNKKLEFSCNINLQKICNNEFLCKFITLDYIDVWFYYLSNNRKYYVCKHNKANEEIISEKFMSKYFYEISKNNFLLDLNKVKV
jgi:hypothetical protein